MTAARAAAAAAVAAAQVRGRHVPGLRRLLARRDGCRHQVGKKLTSRRALGRRPGQAPFEQRPQPGGNLAEVRGEVQHAERARVGRAGPERVSPVAAYASTAPIVKMSLVGPTGSALYQLGRDEPGGAKDRGRRSYLGEVSGLGNAKVDQPGPVLREQHVGGLEVTVDDPRRVHRAQALGEPRRQGRARRGPAAARAWRPRRQATGPAT